MGSGPATHIASLYPAYTLLLMSPYTSIKDVAKTLLGRLSFLLAPLVYERFRNIDTIKQAKCPVFILHGLQDTLIPHSHAEDLKNNCPTFSHLQLAAYMDHNEFDFIGDLIRPFQDFIARIEDQRSLNGMQEIVRAQNNMLRIERQSIITTYSDIDASAIDYSKISETFEILFD